MGLPKMKLFTLIACIRAQIPEQLKFIQLFDEGGSPDFFVSNTVDESCIRSRSSQCYDDCHYITDKSDYYSELKCRFCLIIRNNVLLLSLYQSQKNQICFLRTNAVRQSTPTL